MLMSGRDNYRPQIVNTPTISYEDANSNRVGWKTKANSPMIIWHGCYVPDDHILPDCKHYITGLDTIISNYEGFEADRKTFVKDKYYLSAKTLVKGTPEH